MPGNGQGIPEEATSNKDLTIDGFKALYPDMLKDPLIGGNIDSNNPGVRLVSNDDKIVDMLKIVYLEDYDIARSITEALAECYEFLMDDALPGKQSKPNPEILMRIEWIKILVSSFCSVKGRFADAYKQTATGVLTNAMTEGGWKLLQMPFGKPTEERRDHNPQGGKRP
jgi:hypothetical protein